MVGGIRDHWTYSLCEKRGCSWGLPNFTVINIYLLKICFWGREGVKNTFLEQLVLVWGYKKAAKFHDDCISNPC